MSLPAPASEGRPRAHGPGEVSPDHGPTPGQAYERRIARYDRDRARGAPAPGDGEMYNLYFR